MKKKIAITMGEPGGIGPEVTVKALTDRAINRCCSPVVIGDAAIVKEAVRKSKLSINVLLISDRLTDSKKMFRPEVRAGQL